ncbi:MAG: RNA-binding domain-containing protein [Halobacteriaceae archaeon]
MIYRVDVDVRAPVRDTEVEDRVVRAVERLFPEAEVEVRDGEVVATAHSLDTVAERIREQRILDTARSLFFSNRHGEGFAFDLKKQAAFKGVVNFSVGSEAELGDVHVEVRVHDPGVDEFIDYLAPETDEEGRPVEG